MLLATVSGGGGGFGAGDPALFSTGGRGPGGQNALNASKATRAQLYQIAQRLLQHYPGHPVAWFASGCYYYTAGRYEAARKYF